MKRFFLALDLVDQPELIEQYKAYHAPGATWPEITESIEASGIRLMEIFCTGNRLVMLIETENDFSFEKKAQMDARNPKVQEWEALMDSFQQRLPWAKLGEKWVLMEKIFTTE